jgi:hypothetical protein
MGVTLTGLIVVSVIIIFCLLFAFKIGPAYFEYYAINKQLKALAADPAARGTRREVEGAYVARQTMENIKSVNPSDLVVNKDGNSVVVSAEYSIKVPLFGNLSACMDFNPSSDK